MESEKLREKNQCVRKRRKDGERGALRGFFFWRFRGLRQILSLRSLPQVHLSHTSLHKSASKGGGGRRERFWKSRKIPSH